MVGRRRPAAGGGLILGDRQAQGAYWERTEGLRVDPSHRAANFMGM
jgi:hypothetical protein